MLKTNLIYLICLIVISYCGSDGRNTSSSEDNDFNKNKNAINNNSVNNNANTNINKTDNSDDEKIPENLPITLKMEGGELKAISIAFESFKIDELIPENKRNIENYKVILRQNKQKYYIGFSPKYSETEKLNPPDGGETSLGKSVTFIIGKQDFKLKRRVFFE